MIGSTSVDTDVTRDAHAHLLFCEALPLRVHYCLRQFHLSTVVFCCYRVYTSIRFSCLAVRRLVNVKQYVVCAVAAEGNNVFESVMVCFTQGRGGEGREGGMTVIHILIGMFNSNPMIPQYLNNNLT